MNFKALRRRQNLSLRAAANEIGVNFQSICRYENKGRIPKKWVLKKMIEVYKCTEMELGEAIFSSLKGDEQNEKKVIRTNKRVIQ